MQLILKLPTQSEVTDSGRADEENQTQFQRINWVHYEHNSAGKEPEQFSLATNDAAQLLRKTRIELSAELRETTLLMQKKPAQNLEFRRMES